MQECELKLKLAETSYFELQNYLERNALVLGQLRQKNHYFDTENLDFINNQEMLRVREQDEELILTHKSKASVNEGYFKAEEKEYLLPIKTPFSLDEVLNYIPNYFPNLDSQKLRYLGLLQNYRIVYKWQNFRLELDCSSYGKEHSLFQDYELECETENILELKEVLNKLFLELNIEYTIQTQTKFARFLNKALALPRKDIVVL